MSLPSHFVWTAAHTQINPRIIALLNPYTSLKASVCPAATAQKTRLVSRQPSPPAEGHCSPVFASRTTHAIQQQPPPWCGSILICICAHCQLFHSNTDALLQSLCCTYTGAAALSRRPFPLLQLSSPCCCSGSNAQWRDLFPFQSCSRSPMLSSSPLLT